MAIYIYIYKLTVRVVCFPLGNSPASEFYMPTFWNTPSVEQITFQNVGI
jgi:hypothetical protein